MIPEHVCPLPATSDDMNPIFVASPPKTAVSQVPNQPAAPRRGAAQAQFDGVSNAAESPKAQRAESPKGHRSHGLLGAVRNVFSHIGGSKSHAAQSSGVQHTTQVQGKQLLKLDSEAERQHVDNVFQNFAKISDRLSPLVFEQTLPGDQRKAVSLDLARLGQGLRALTEKIVEGDDGNARRLGGLSDATAARLAELGRSGVVTRDTTDIPSIARHLEDTASVLQLVAAEIAPEHFAFASGAFQDPLFDQVHARLGTSATPHGKYAELAANKALYKSDPSNLGVRYKDIALREDTAFKLRDGTTYFGAHELDTPSGRPVATATVYPKNSDMPKYLQMLRESPTSRLWVLTSGKEIRDRKFPDYFRKDATWGPHRVTVEAVPGQKTYGVAHVKEYTMTLHTPGEPPKSITVSHFEDWPDKQTLPAEDLLAFCQDQAQQGDPHGPAVHCAAGIGRTGTVVTAYAMTLEPDLRAEDAVQHGREVRGPAWVQTPDQLKTTTLMQREMEARRHASDAGVVYENVRSDWQRQSKLDPLEPVYENLPYNALGAPEPRYANVTGR